MISIPHLYFFTSADSSVIKPEMPNSADAIVEPAHTLLHAGRMVQSMTDIETTVLNE